MFKKKGFAALSVVLGVLTATAWLAASQEGPRGSGKWVYGHVSYASDGSKCANACGISVWGSAGWDTRDGCTNSAGDYKMYVSVNSVRSLYYKGTKVWEGDVDPKGGERIDFKVK